MRPLHAYVADRRRVETGLDAVESGGGGAGLAVHVGAELSCRISSSFELACVSPSLIFTEMGQGGITVNAFVGSSTYFKLVWRDF